MVMTSTGTPHRTPHITLSIRVTHAIWPPVVSRTPTGQLPPCCDNANDPSATSPWSSTELSSRTPCLASASLHKEEA
jgi:hypothetical protein